MSPEQMEGKRTHKADVWALGCIVLQFITGVLPYHGEAHQYGVMSRLLSKTTPLQYAKEHLEDKLMGTEESGPTIYAESEEL